MSQIINNNNNYVTAPTSPNPYIFRKLKNMDQAQVMKREWEDWTRTYHKTLKGIEAMIDMQRIIKNMKKLAREANTMVTEIEGSILAASTDNQMTNTTNIAEISEDLWYLVQSDIEDQTFQIQRMLADELDRYKGRGNTYVNENIWEIQELYISEEQKKKEEGRIEDKEVILIKLYKILESSSTRNTSFINEEIDNLLKYMKFVKFPTQTRLFQPLPHYQSLYSRGEQDPEFWKEVATALVDNWHNTEILRNRYLIKMFQEGPPCELFFIAIDNWEQVIISPNKKTMAVYMAGELEVLV